MNPKPRLLLAVKESYYPTIFSPVDEHRLRSIATLMNPPPKNADKAFLLEQAAGAEVFVTSWDTAALDGDILQRAGALRMVCHAAGSIRPVVTEAFWDRHIAITSGAEAIARGVAEFCLGLILTESKQICFQAWGTRQGRWAESGKAFGGAFEIYQQNIGLIGAGHIGRHLIRLLKNFDAQLNIYDPYITAEEARVLGVTKMDTLDELFARCRVVSLHAPTNESTRHMLRGAHFAALQPGSVFINTAGGTQIHEAEFVAELEKGRFVACIDRCPVEPPPPDHPFRRLPNVLLTPHIAGVMAQNRLRIGTLVVDEVERYVNRQAPRFPVTKEALARMA